MDTGRSGTPLRAHHALGGWLRLRSAELCRARGRRKWAEKRRKLHQAGRATLCRGWSGGCIWVFSWTGCRPRMQVLSSPKPALEISR